MVATRCGSLSPVNKTQRPPYLQRVAAYLWPSHSWCVQMLVPAYPQDPELFLATNVLGTIQTDKKGRFLGTDLVTVVLTGKSFEEYRLTVKEDLATSRTEAVSLCNTMLKGRFIVPSTSRDSKCHWCYVLTSTAEVKDNDKQRFYFSPQIYKRSSIKKVNSPREDSSSTSAVCLELPTRLLTICSLPSEGREKSFLSFAHFLPRGAAAKAQVLRVVAESPVVLSGPKEDSRNKCSTS